MPSFFMNYNIFVMTYLKLRVVIIVEIIGFYTQIESFFILILKYSK